VTLRITTVDELPEHLRHQVAGKLAPAAPAKPAQPFQSFAQQTGQPAPSTATARGRPPRDGGMNKTEAAYAEHLAARQQAGEVLWFAFEGLRLRLAEKTFYNPDFAVQLADLSLEVHEVKGHWEDDARVKIKVAAAMFPQRFVAVQRVQGAWKFETFGGSDADR